MRGRTSILVLAAAVVAVMCGGCPRPSGTGSLSSDRDFDILFPAGWEVLEGFQGAAILGRSPQEDPQDAFLENLNVVIEKVDRNVGIDEYFAASLNNMQASLNNFRKLEEGTARVAGQPTRTLIYTHESGQVTMKVLAYLFIRNGRAYVVTGTALPDTFEDYLETFQEVTHSITFPRSGGPTQRS